MSGQRAEQRQFLPSSLNEQVFSSELGYLDFFAIACIFSEFGTCEDCENCEEYRFSQTLFASFKREFTCRPLTRLSNHNSRFKREIYTAHETSLCCVANLRGVDNEGRLLY